MPLVLLEDGFDDGILDLGHLREMQHPVAPCSSRCNGAIGAAPNTWGAAACAETCGLVQSLNSKVLIPEKLWGYTQGWIQQLCRA